VVITQLFYIQYHLLLTARPKSILLAQPVITDTILQILQLAYNVRKSITAAPAIKRLTPASLAIAVTIYPHLLTALYVQQLYHNAQSAAMPQLALPAIPVIS
jgi:hypothetical protein